MSLPLILETRTGLVCWIGLRAGSGNALFDLFSYGALPIKQNALAELDDWTRIRPVTMVVQHSCRQQRKATTSIVHNSILLAGSHQFCEHQ